MKKLLCVLFSILFVSCCLTVKNNKTIKAEEINYNLQNNNYVEHEVIIVCNDQCNFEDKDYFIEQLGTVSIDNTDRYILLIRDESSSVEELIDLFRNNENVIDVEPNWIEEIEQAPILNETNNEEIIIKADATKYQWSMHNDGHLLGAGNGADMGYSNWNKEDVVLDEVVVAVLDSGVDETNPDLDLWTDPGNIGLMNTIPGADIHGYDSGENGSTIYLERDHGTHCAGIIGAKWNGFGTSGVAPNAKIMSVHHRDSYDSFIKCFDYIIKACEAGVEVKVVSCSWSTGAFHSYILDSLIRQLGENFNTVCVFAAGNSSTDTDMTSGNPSVLENNPYVIVVGSINPDGTVSEFSSYGQNTVDIFAPGTLILSTDFAVESDATEYQYYPEFDDNPICKIGFEEDDSVDYKQAFQYLINNGAYVTDKMSFDGKSCLYIPNETLRKISPNFPDSSLITSDVIDLSGLENKPHYMALKMLPIKKGKIDTALLNYSVPLTNGDLYSNYFDTNCQMTSATGWGNMFIELPDDTDFNYFTFLLTFNMFNSANKNIDDYDICIDTITFGNDKVPYVYMSGTSMATPAISGEAAVIFGTYKNIKAEEVVARILSGTNQNDAYTYVGLCSSNELCNVDKALSNELAPYIRNITSIDDNSLQIDAYFINNLKAAYYKTDNMDEYKKANITSSNENSLTIQLPEDCENGVVNIIIENEYGKSPTKRIKIDFNKTYEYFDYVDVTIPKYIDDILDTWNSYTLTAYNDSIYFLHQTAVAGAKPEIEPNKIIRYNINSKDFDVIDLPQNILDDIGMKNVECYSACPQNGKLVFIVMGSGQQEYSRVDAMLSLDHKDNWELEKVYDEFVVRDQNFVMMNVKNELLLVGSSQMYICKWSDEENCYKPIGSSTRRAPNTVVCENDLWVSGGFISGLAEATEPGIDRLVLTQIDEELEIYDLKQTITFDNYRETKADMYYGIAGVHGGIIAIGPTSNDNNSDTFFIPLDDDGNPSEPTSLNIRAYDGPLYHPSCVGYKNNIYVLGSTIDNRHIFSYTGIKTDSFIGDYQPYIPVATGIH